ncbi:MAG: DUF1553 domain-containing protein [Planctomycetota bacterium]|nr:DUF1553 domain-containing protein [Planctomycetota bacterium]
MTPRVTRIGLFIFSALAGSLLLFHAAARGEETIEEIDFGRDIRPILSNRCFKCHGPDATTREADLRLDVATATPQPADRAIIRPGDPAESLLYQRITEEDPAERMPPESEGGPLTEEEQDRIRRWIEQGGARSGHWAFTAPEKPPLPHVAKADWPQTAIDTFVLARLEGAGLAHAPEASRRTLIRRLSFDLRGLPPTPEQVEAFVQDPDPAAYERLVEAMLKSPQYGERMAQGWLDLARYADTTGFSADSPREMWLYRDWVIDAFNRNMPFDQFTLAQLAGDMLPGATTDDRIATGFHRSSMQALGNNPRKEEFRVKGIIDRVNTTARVFLGLTMGCAECHDHKFDPITQKEFYGMFAIFNNVPHYGEDFEVHGPRIEARSPLAATRQAEIDRAVADLWAQAPARGPDTAAVRQQQWEKELADALGDGGPTDLAGNTARWAEVPTPPLQIAANEQKCPEGDLTITARIETRKPIADIVCKYDSARGARAFVFGIGGEGEANAKAGHLYAWISSRADRFEGVQIYGSIPVNDGQPHHVALVFRRGEAIDLYVDGRRDPATRQIGKIPSSIASSDCDLLLGAGYGLEKDEKKFILTGPLRDVAIYDRAFPQVAQFAAAADDLRKAIVTPVAERSDLQQTALNEFFTATDRSHLPPALRLQIEALEHERELLDRTYQAQVMEEMKTPRVTHVHLRGNYQDRGDRVEPMLPACLPPMTGPIDRLAFARWLVDRRHPLTARVTVNRIWQHYFGTGLVATADDFGRQSEWPSHPELLDYLAVEFMESGWDLKALHRQIVHSSTYRQSARVGAAAYQRDPDNRLLSRGPRMRLPAEQIRDNALAISGLLSAKVGGPSVYPWQPPGILEEKGQLQYHPAWVTSRGEDRYRRGLYVYWKRMHLYPSLATFGAPTRERCVVKRPVANTPLQALVLLNDPVFVEAARHFARHILTHSGPAAEQRIDYAVRRCLGRPPTETEAARYAEFLHQQTARFADSPTEARDWLASETPADDAELAPRAAWTLLAATLLNLDETISKP